jgi:two-component system, chemotaxis family, protein-glutamate methylesterase/glutaminase
LNKIKIVIIDDSHVIHILLGKIISEHHEIKITGNAYNGEQGVDLVKKLSPDVVIMDIGMPRMNGLEAIKEIMKDKPTPVIVFSSATKANAEIGFQAIELGAVQLIEKPSVKDISQLQDCIEDNLIKAIITVGESKIIKNNKTNVIPAAWEEKQSGRFEKAGISTIEKKAVADDIADNFPVIGIAASTGGPQTLKVFLESLSNTNISASMIIVQHIAEGFMDGFCDWLAKYSSWQVSLARDNEYPELGRIYIAPGGHHLSFHKNGSFDLLDAPPHNGIRPSADLMFSSLGEVYKERAIAIVLTGMGSDGTEGLYKIKENNGYIISQDQESSIIYGMPKSAAETGLVDKVINISGLSGYLEEYCMSKFSKV